MKEMIENQRAIIKLMINKHFETFITIGTNDMDIT